jgi:hypothetical protein
LRLGFLVKRENTRFSWFGSFWAGEIPDFPIYAEVRVRLGDEDPDESG